ncbi:hypothetical protein BYT27DRAFT_6861707 [Phlegmacium glaucopus]|nr:hypothetical protein BYT27DRAFT_6861707 [Phlegmacium glaucopus]
MDEQTKRWKTECWLYLTHRYRLNRVIYILFMMVMVVMRTGTRVKEMGGTKVRSREGTMMKFTSNPTYRMVVGLCTVGGVWKVCFYD